MNYFDIKTTMSIYPTLAKTHDIIYITRGATATLNFNFGTKIYSFSDVDQFSYVLKQDKQYYTYKMFTYLIPTEDTEVDASKVYYSNVEAFEGDEFASTGIQVMEPSGNPKDQNYYEVVEDNHSWRDTKYIVDSHFSHTSGDGYEYITLILSSAETAQFKTTVPDANVQCEVAIRLNTDIFGNLGNQDSIIIEPQHPLAIVDSLYSQAF